MKDTRINDKRPRPLELLAPARDCETARQAILHGADAVYIGASSHGARAGAANRVEEIAELVRFAHQFRARIYVTVNTIIFPEELEKVQSLVWQLYHAGVDALIVQDMALLEMNLPPIELHASTQCDISTLAQAQFLERVGFSQLVLARELTITEITDICRHVSVPVECFVHGALCVSYSGRCHASLACGGRSANRGECAQICRLPYTLTDGRGKILARNKYLLSMHDLNTSHLLEDMVKAGVSSFKIEGRLKDTAYVKNITAHYRRLLDTIIQAHPDEYTRSSCGSVHTTFTPDPAKSFNRGFTDFCLTHRKNTDIASLLTPKSLGEPVADISTLNNGDGISWFEGSRYTGTRVNRVDGKRILTADRMPVPRGAQLRRTYDVKWERTLSGNTATRKIAVRMRLTPNSLTVNDERGAEAIVPLETPKEQARTPQNRRDIFARLGNTIYTLEAWEDVCGEDVFIPNSVLSALRRKAIEALEISAEAIYQFRYRRTETPGAICPQTELDFRANVANALAREFYRKHGVKSMEEAAETSGQALSGRRVMTSRHCPLRQLGHCLKEKPHSVIAPFTLDNGHDRFLLKPDCKNCRTEIYKI